MKLAVVSHSLVAERQFWFYEWLADHKGVDVMRIAPNHWGRYERSWGYPVMNAGDMVNYEFYDDAFRALEDFKPDVIYVQQEAYCKVAAQFLRFAKRTGAKFALFVWDNINDYRDPYPRNVLRDTDLVVCGSGRAESLVRPVNENTLRCIQVGLNTDAFPLMEDQEPEIDVIFQGRLAPEKGYRVLQQAANGRFTVLWPDPDRSVPYANLAARYSKANVHASPSLDTPQWKEQHAGYANLEALSCGLYVATSDSESIVEALEGCPGVRHHRQGDPEALASDIGSLLGKGQVNEGGSFFVKEHYGYDAVAGKLLPALEALVE